MRRARFAAIATLAGAAAIAGLAVAQSGGRRPFVPHEDLPSPGGDKVSPMIGATGSGNNPAAFTAGDKVLPRPSTDQPASAPKDKPVLGAGGFGADRDTKMTPDSNTGPDGTLHYVSVFNPDVLPFKRMSALDAATPDFQLGIARPALVEVPVGGTTSKQRDRFWGDVYVQLSPGVDAPLPSVAPDMRILSYEIEPKLPLTFSKDSADNFYVRSDESRASGTYHLVFLADADAGYFAPALPTGRYTPRRVAAETPPELTPQLPDAVRESARRQLRRLGVDEDMSLDVAFNRIVGYFRGFEAKDLPAGGKGNLYDELCDNQAGVCRHRSFAFMITSNALGIPTRYVQNEAHAFAEVWFPGRSWQRIDLGGAALRMDVTGADNKTLHRPRGEDPFSKPSAYNDSYTQLEGEINGLTSQQLDDKRKSLADAPASGDFDGTNSGSGSVADPFGTDRITPDPNLPTVTQDPKKITPKLSVTLADTSAFRGDVVHVEGLATTADGKRIADHPIDVYLAPAGRNGTNPVPLGRTVTDASGRFSQDFTVPSALNLATYEIYLASQEDAFHNAALSN
ncbi:MAG TPA: transglutaminase domain-containing protein [Kofleriaceae bacterium]|nr:transglutaminase domain-containing protein [Kofleriaceae bacterium]